MYSKLVIISTNALDRRINQLFDTKYLLQKGIEIEYWDVSALTYNIVMPLDYVEGIKVCTFKSKQEFYTYVKCSSSTNTLYLIYMNFDAKTAFCYRELSRRKVPMAYCVNGVLPPLSSVSSKLKKVNLERVLKNRFYGLLKKTSLFAPLKYQFNTCAKANVDYKIDALTKIIPFNSTDFIASKQLEELDVNKPYIVFIDQYLPLHPDNRVIGLHDINPAEYYAKVNKFFSIIERQEQCRVVIAAHPIAQSYKNSNPFNGREIYFFKTNNLVKNAKGVICHHSTAISYVSIFKKPLIVLTSDTIKKEMTLIDEYCRAFSEILGGQLINLDHIPDVVRFIDIDKEKYDSYKYNYVTNPSSESLSNGEILYSVLKGNYE